MADRVLEQDLISANDLRKVTVFSRMRVYAVATISGGDPRMPTHRTEPDRHDGCTPTWNSMFQFPIAAATDTRGLVLHVALRTKGIFGAHHVGDVFVPIDDLLPGVNDNKGATESRPATYQVRRPHSARAHGVLYFCYRFIDVPAAGAAANKEGQDPEHATAADNKVAVAAAPAMAYRPPQQAPAAYSPQQQAPPAAYLPQQQAPAYSPHQQAPAYSPPQYHQAPYTGYPPQSYPSVAPQPYGYNNATQQPPQRKGGMGMGLGLGLLGGALGGMMIGDMISDANADATYDAGFDDGFSF